MLLPTVRNKFFTAVTISLLSALGLVASCTSERQTGVREAGEEKEYQADIERRRDAVRPDQPVPPPGQERKAVQPDQPVPPPGQEREAVQPDQPVPPPGQERKAPTDIESTWERGESPEEVQPGQTE